MEESLLIIYCSEGGRKALQKMSSEGFRLPSGVCTFELPCTGRINDVMLMETLQNGVRGIFVAGCREENCKYLDGNKRALRRIKRIKKLLSDAGIEGKHIEMQTFGPDEGKRLYSAINDFAGKVGVS
ncbi:MAG: hypothetical protein DRP87_00250 [Spirochaetes bacterium]|nr:MAG: hypothetical protein DRP87_00250 [Spirochaetota bacterium]